MPSVHSSIVSASRIGIGVEHSTCGVM
jgi:hypothetical protein